ncbi:MAG: hypothetical protein WDW36_007590 [Sanguina aurantia]
MDDHNAHHFWGISPALDLESLCGSSSGVVLESVIPSPRRILQVSPYDARHTLTALSRVNRIRSAQDSSAAAPASSSASPQAPPNTSSGSSSGTSPSPPFSAPSMTSSLMTSSVMTSSVMTSSVTPPAPALHLYVHEEEPEGLARHLLLLAVLLDGQLQARERSQLLLEVHGNSLLQEGSAATLERLARELELIIVRCSGSGGSSNGGSSNGGSSSGQAAACAGPAVPGSASQACSTPLPGDLGELLDLSLLRFQERDAMVEVLRRYRRASAPYDMVAAWDSRCRKWYADRYDFRKNLIDYDYHMRLQPLGVFGQEEANGTVIHFHHFRYWRMHGIAYELRDCMYSVTNRSLLSSAVGRTKEFKDRSGRDVGRSVTAWGWWGDILNSPYHAWGTTCHEQSLFTVSNKQFQRTAVDIAEFNVMALLYELRTGERYTLSSGAEAPRALLARGPTTMEDLENEAAKSTAAAAAKAATPAAEGDAAEAAESESSLSSAGSATPAAPAAAADGCAVAPVSDPTTAGTVNEPVAVAGSSTHSPASDPAAISGPGSASALSEQGPQSAAAAATSSAEPAAGEGLGQGGAAGAQCASVRHAGATPRTHRLPRQGLTAETAHCGPEASHGGRGERASAAGSSTVGCDTEGASQPSRAPASKPASKPAAGGGAERDGDSGSSSHPAAASTPGNADSTAAGEAVREELAQLRLAEALLDAAAWRRLRGRGVRLFLSTGSDLVKAVTGKSKHRAAFDLACVGHRHVHLAGSEHRLQEALKPGAMLVLEGARHLLQLKRDQTDTFAAKACEIASTAGWSKLPSLPDGMTDAHLAFHRTAAAAPEPSQKLCSQ